jgi:hypothetical protein
MVLWNLMTQSIWLKQINLLYGQTSKRYLYSMEDLILYLKLMRVKLKPFELTTNIDIIMEELTNIATENWVKNGKPDLTHEQFDIVLRRSLARNTTLN